MNMKRCLSEVCRNGEYLDSDVLAERATCDPGLCFGSRGYNEEVAQVRSEWIVMVGRNGNHSTSY